MNLRTAGIRTTASTALLGKPELSAADLASLSGIPVDQARRFWQALGFPAVTPDEKLFTRRDVDVLRFIADLFERGSIAPEVLVQMARATGQALARVATMHVASIAPQIEAAVRDGTLTDRDVADTVATIAEELMASHEPFLGYIWRRHLLAAMSQVAASAGERSGEGETMNVVGFADLVDFTAMSERMTEGELARVVDRFEAIAYAEIPDRGGRVVKMLGDEVMFCNPDPVASAHTALAISRACADDELLPDVRVGLALGPTLAWEGDVYGKTVNLASRLVGVAHPGTVLVSDELGQRLQGQEFVLRDLHPVKLKGIGKARLRVLRAPDPEEDEKDRKRREKARS